MRVHNAENDEAGIICQTLGGGIRRRAAHTRPHHPRQAHKVAEIESFEYFPGDSKVYREWLAQQPIFRQYDRWLMMLFVGLTVGMMG
jgi:hypothetical protein